ncbi:hypothetical protein LBMAG42_18140 [Deltaproteobacteria bacterium]|nr:hypothetical protein LBMAG42_18140 [Deltaproteobacteria bacterium]
MGSRPPPTPPTDPWGDTRRIVGASFAISSLVMTWSAGALGAAVVRFVGPALAALGQMYVHGVTEPLEPKATFWLGWTLLAAALPLPFAVRREWRRASLAALPFALLPWWQLAELYRLSGAEPPVSG